MPAASCRLASQKFKVGHAQRQPSARDSPVTLSLKYDNAGGITFTAIGLLSCTNNLFSKNLIEETAFLLLFGRFLG